MHKWAILLIVLVAVVVLWKTHLLAYANVLAMLFMTHFWIVAIWVIISIPILLVLRLFIKEDKNQ